MKALHYFWITIMALLSVLTLSCEPEPEPPRHEMPDPYIIPSLIDNIQQKDKLIGTWAQCGISMNENVEPGCSVDPLFIHEMDTLIFSDSTFTLRTSLSEQTWPMFGHTDTSFTYRDSSLVKKIKFRNHDSELLIYGWVDHHSWAGDYYEIVCFHKID